MDRPMELPVYQGYTVDERLREFRRVDEDGGIEWVPFESEEGQRLKAQMIADAIEEHLPGRVIYLGRD